MNSSRVFQNDNSTVESTINPKANHHGSTFGMSEEFLFGTLVALACLSVVIPCILIMYYKNRTHYFVGIKRQISRLYPSMASYSGTSPLHNEVDES